MPAVLTENISSDKIASQMPHNFSPFFGCPLVGDCHEDL